MLVENKEKIKNIIFKYPELMSTDAVDKIKEKFNAYLQLQEDLNSYRDNVRNLEKLLKKESQEFEDLKNILTIEYDTKKVETVEFTTVNITVINPTDGSNKNYK